MDILIPSEIARFIHAPFSEVQWINPFSTVSILEIKNIKGALIYKAYIRHTLTLWNNELIGFIKEDYTAVITNVKSGEIKSYHITYN
jgi:hypothetical protein